MSATPAINSIYLSSITSVIIGILNSFLAILNHSIPFSLVSLNFLLLYGNVRGLKAPPLKKCAPILFTFDATSKINSSDSTIFGPAITGIVSPPNSTPATSNFE